MAILRRNNRLRREKHHPELITGNFELHFEEVINRNRTAVIAFFATGLVLLAVFIPNAVYHSVAVTEKVNIEAERGDLVNLDFVSRKGGDITASDNSYIEFKVKDN